MTLSGSTSPFQKENSLNLQPKAHLEVFPKLWMKLWVSGDFGLKVVKTV